MSDPNYWRALRNILMTEAGSIAVYNSLANGIALPTTVEELEKWGDRYGLPSGTVPEGTLPEEAFVNKGAGSIGKLSGSLDGLSAAERTVVSDLLSQGNDVQIIPRSNVEGVVTPDYMVNGVKTELKTLTGTSLNTPVTRIQDGFKQGAQTVIIDGRNTGLTLEQANQVLDRAAGTYSNKVLPGQVEIWTKDGIVRR